MLLLHVLCSLPYTVFLAGSIRILCTLCAIFFRMCSALVVGVNLMMLQGRVLERIRRVGKNKEEQGRMTSFLTKYHWSYYSLIPVVWWISTGLIMGDHSHESWFNNRLGIVYCLLCILRKLGLLIDWIQISHELTSKGDTSITQQWRGRWWYWWMLISW